MPSLEKKNQQRYRTMSYFINASIEIIKEEGLTNLSIRKAADRAGYNSATLYHYFSSFEELCMFASIKFVDDYAKDLPNYVAQEDTPLTTYFKIWECFCYHSFKHPDEFWLLFLKNIPESSGITHYFEEYYAIYPKNWSAEINEYENMLASDNLLERDHILLTNTLAKQEITIPISHIRQINEMNILIYRGMLSQIRENPGKLTPDEATKRAIKYMKRTLMAYGID